MNRIGRRVVRQLARSKTAQAARRLTYRRRLELNITEKPNRAWSHAKRGARVTFVRLPIIRPTDKIFAMGSCFAREVRAALSREFGNVVYWPSFEIALARDIYQADGRHVTHEGVRAIVDQFLAVRGSADATASSSEHVRAVPRATAAVAGDGVRRRQDKQS